MKERMRDRWEWSELGGDDVGIYGYLRTQMDITLSKSLSVMIPTKPALLSVTTSAPILFISITFAAFFTSVSREIVMTFEEPPNKGKHTKTKTRGRNRHNDKQSSKLSYK